ncbi:MAG: hypothetical protein KatS3mg035_2104 [Bacteroidia bacterium]|nr:MAG: hypothetical protein KatS3mg035_2104 [Bacteroidia bacterium]
MILWDYMMREDISPKMGLIFITLLLLFVAFYLGLMRVDAYLRNRAVDECGKISKFEKKDTTQSAIISYPVADVYQDCLKRKGY